MKATEELKEEHKAIKIALSVLRSVNKKLEYGDKVDQYEVTHIRVDCAQFLETKLGRLQRETFLESKVV